MRVSAVVAMTAVKRGIGAGGDLPWGRRLKGDLKFFQELTTRGPGAVAPAEQRDANANANGNVNAVLMGRKTWESVPVKFRPLPNRVNVVLSRTMKPEDVPAGVMLHRSLEDAVRALRESPNPPQHVFVVGGAEIYAAALEAGIVDDVYVTEVKQEFESCDAFFPPIPAESFEGPMPVPGFEGDRTDDGISYAFTLYRRKGASGESPTKRARAATTTPSIPTQLTTPPKHEELQYLDLVREILDNGVVKSDRTGVGTKSVFGRMMRFSLRDGTIPLLTTKRVFWKGVAVELLWFISGDTSAKTLQEQGVKIWDGNSTREYLDSIGLKDREVGDLGPVYGFQWRHFGAEYKTMHDDYKGKGVDQLAQLVDDIKRNPDSRRHIMSAWNPLALPQMALPPCHVMSQFYVANGELSCQMYQRSADMGLGVPFNIASYALLTHLLAKVCGLKPGEYVHVIGDAHVYRNHEDALREQLTREPRPFPKLVIADRQQAIDSFTFDDLQVVGYDPHKAVKMDMAV